MCGKLIVDSKRRSYVDIIKGWAMLIIITFHCSQGCFSGFIGEFLGRPWSVAVFFIVAGFFLKEDVLSLTMLFLKKKLYRLYVPATVIYACSVLLHNLFVSFGWYPIGYVHPTSGVPFNYYGLKDIVIGLAKVLAAGGSGELAMGAMWFIYTLLYAFVSLALLYWVMKRICKKETLFYLMSVLLLMIAAVSCVLTQKYGIMINRFSTAFTAMWLIWWGMIINQKWRWQFDKWWGLWVAVLVFVHCVIMQRSEITLARNEYQDLVQLTIGSTAAIYLLGFIGKMIKDSFVGKFFALLGRESLYLMAFHIIGFFICNSLLVKLGVFKIGDEKGLYTYKFGNNPLILLAYVSFAIGTSFVILYLYRFAKHIVLQVAMRSKK